MPPTHTSVSVINYCVITIVHLCILENNNTIFDRCWDPSAVWLRCEMQEWQWRRGWLVGDTLSCDNLQFHQFTDSAGYMIIYIYLYIIRYILYKLPNVNDNGLSYLYMDESTNGWQRSRETINSKSGTLGNTLKPLLEFYDRKVKC